MLMDRISKAIIRAAHSGRLVAVVTIDLDGFKAINDRYGHNVGDWMLKEIALRMKSATRDTDTITRLGGDEFVYVATELDSMADLKRTISRLLDVVCQPLYSQQAVASSEHELWYRDVSR